MKLFKQYAYADFDISNFVVFYAYICYNKYS